MKAEGEVDVHTYILLTSALVGPGHFTPKERPYLYPFGLRLSGPQNQSGRRGEDKILYPTGTQTLSSWLASVFSVSIQTTLLGFQFV
jgi:hypothetical protein